MGWEGNRGFEKGSFRVVKCNAVKDEAVNFTEEIMMSVYAKLNSIPKFRLDSEYTGSKGEVQETFSWDWLADTCGKTKKTLRALREFRQIKEDDSET